tara:strand:+ start:4900 stop:5496 length:597 start_codon:yes stop_codon:yes gene_type:complete
MGRTKKKRNKNRKKGTKKIYSDVDFASGDGMLTSVWGPSLWHYLHTMSFNYPVKPTKQDKKSYKDFVKNLKNVLPCGYCRLNFVKNLKSVPLRALDLKNRCNFSKWMFRLHEHINKMLGKKSNLTFVKVQERYEHFRSRCTIDIGSKTKIVKSTKTRKKEKGCVEALYGKKSKCIIKIVPNDKKEPTFQMDDKCKKKR